MNLYLLIIGISFSLSSCTIEKRSLSPQTINSGIFIFNQYTAKIPVNWSKDRNEIKINPAGIEHVLSWQAKEQDCLCINYSNNIYQATVYWIHPDDIPQVRISLKHQHKFKTLTGQLQTNNTTTPIELVMAPDRKILLVKVNGVFIEQRLNDKTECMQCSLFTSNKLSTRIDWSKKNPEAIVTAISH